MASADTKAPSSRMITLGPSTHSSQSAKPSAPKTLNVEESFPDLVYSREDLLNFHRPTSWLHPSFTVIPYITTVESLEPVSFQPFDIEQIEAAADAALAAKTTNPYRGGATAHKNPSYHRNEKGTWPPRRTDDDEDGEKKFDRNHRGSGHRGDDLPEWASQNVDDILSGQYEPGSVIGQIPDKNQWKRDGPRRGHHSMYDDFTSDDNASPGHFEALSSSSEPTRWEYIDPQGETQGPFDSEDMTKWFVNGFFPSGLRVRKYGTQNFVRICDLGASEGQSPFDPRFEHAAPPQPIHHLLLPSIVERTDNLRLSEGADHHDLPIGSEPHHADSLEASYLGHSLPMDHRMYDSFSSHGSASRQPQDYTVKSDPQPQPSANPWNGQIRAELRGASGNTPTQSQHSDFTTQQPRHAHTQPQSFAPAHELSPVFQSQPSLSSSADVTLEQLQQIRSLMKGTQDQAVLVHQSMLTSADPSYQQFQQSMFERLRQQYEQLQQQYYALEGLFKEQQFKIKEPPPSPMSMGIPPSPQRIYGNVEASRPLYPGSLYPSAGEFSSSHPTHLSLSMLMSTQPSSGQHISIRDLERRGAMSSEALEQKMISQQYPPPPSHPVYSALSTHPAAVPELSAVALGASLESAASVSPAMEESPVHGELTSSLELSSSYGEAVPLSSSAEGSTKKRNRNKNKKAAAKDVAVDVVSAPAPTPSKPAPAPKVEAQTQSPARAKQQPQSSSGQRVQQAPIKAAPSPKQVPKPQSQQPPQQPPQPPQQPALLQKTAAAKPQQTQQQIPPHQKLPTVKPSAPHMYHPHHPHSQQGLLPTPTGIQPNAAYSLNPQMQSKRPAFADQAYPPESRPLSIQQIQEEERRAEEERRHQSEADRLERAVEERRSAPKGWGGRQTNLTGTPSLLDIEREERERESLIEEEEDAYDLKEYWGAPAAPAPAPAPVPTPANVWGVKKTATVPSLLEVQLQELKQQQKKDSLSRGRGGGAIGTSIWGGFDKQSLDSGRMQTPPIVSSLDALSGSSGDGDDFWDYGTPSKAEGLEGKAAPSPIRPSSQKQPPIKGNLNQANVSQGKAANASANQPGAQQGKGGQGKQVQAAGKPSQAPAGKATATGGKKKRMEKMDVSSLGFYASHNGGLVAPEDEK